MPALGEGASGRAGVAKAVRGGKDSIEGPENVVAHAGPPKVDRVISMCPFRRDYRA